MIFVTIGTQQQNFERLFRYIDKINVDEEIIVQKGKNNSVDNNPQTYSAIVYIFSIIFVVVFSLFISKDKLFRKDS